MLLLWLTPGAWGRSPEPEVPKPAESSAAQQQPAQDEATIVVDKDPKGAPYAAGELIVTYKEGASPGAKDKAKKAVGGEQEEAFSFINAEKLSFPEIKNEKAREARQSALERKKRELEANPAVEAVDYNYQRKLTYTPNDTSFGQQWSLRQINAPFAWDKTLGGAFPPPKIAVLDTGIDDSHPDIRQVYAQRDFAPFFHDSDAEDVHGHGTHVAGIAVANTGNSRGIAGACPGCDLLVGRVMVDDGGTWDDDIVSGIRWAADNGADVINMSFGGPGWSQATRDAVVYAHNKGAVLVAGVGNDARQVTDFYPCGYQEVICVAATDDQDQQASYSNWGSMVDVSAPGGDQDSGRVGILSTVPTFVNSSGYEEWQGTSLATPQVSGLAGLLASQGLTNTQIRDRIQTTAVDLGSAGVDSTYGYGRINAGAAVWNDTAKPTVSKPSSRFIPSIVGSANVGVEVYWTGSDNSGGSGIGSYDLWHRLYPNDWSQVNPQPGSTARSFRSVKPGSYYAYTVRAQDKAGNWGDYQTSNPFWLRVDASQEDGTGVSYPSGSWSAKSALSGAYGGYVKYST